MANKKPGMIEWEKPNGSKIKTNTAPANIEKAKELGWKEVKSK